MPNIKSAVKRVKVSKTKTLRNRMVKSGVKTAIRQARIYLISLTILTPRLTPSPARGRLLVAFFTTCVIALKCPFSQIDQWRNYDASFSTCVPVQ